MSYEQICRAVKTIQRKYEETDPFRLCRDMNILLRQVNLGTEPDAIKGFYLKEKNIRSITVNCDLPEAIQRVIVAHELGHCVLHSHSGMQAFHDIALFDECSILEKEANLFAAEFLLNDQDVYEVLNQDTAFFATARTFCVPPEVLDFKFRIMKWKGYKVTEPPISAQNNFLSKLEVQNDADYYSG